MSLSLRRSLPRRVAGLWRQMRTTKRAAGGGGKHGRAARGEANVVVLIYQHHIMRRVAVFSWGGSQRVWVWINKPLPEQRRKR